MRCLDRNKRNILVCNQYQAGNIMLFAEPKSISINYQATNSDSDLIALGVDYPMYIRIKADIEQASNFITGDRVYIYVTPTNFDGLCKDADYEVDSDPIISLNSIEVTLKRLSGKQ